MRSEKKFKKFNNYFNNKENNKKFYSGNKKNKNNFHKKKYNHNNQYKYQEKSIEEYERNYLKRRMKEDVERPFCPICNEPIYIIEEAIRGILSTVPVTSLRAYIFLSAGAKFPD